MARSWSPTTHPFKWRKVPYQSKLSFCQFARYARNMRAGGAVGERLEGNVSVRSRHVAKCVVDEHMMPELSGDDADQAHLHGSAAMGAVAQAPEGPAPVLHGFNIEIAGLAQRFGTKELVHKSGNALAEKRVERGPEHALGRPGRLPR